MEQVEIFRGFIVHGYADLRRDRLYLLGRLDDGRSFAAAESRWRPPLYIGAGDRDRAARLLGEFPHEIRPADLESFAGGEPLFRLDFSSFADRSAAARVLEGAGIPAPGGDTKPVEAFLTERLLRGPVEIRGLPRPGRRVDLVFSNPGLAPPAEPPATPPDASPSGIAAGRAAGPAATAPLRVASIDIETDVRDGSILAASLHCVPGAALLAGGPIPGEPLVRVRLPPGSTGEGLLEGGHRDEASLLRAFIEDLRQADPDVLTGWNFLDFDFPRLAARAEYHRIPFTLGRSGEGAKFFPGEGRRSAAALVPGRQVIDALRIVRSGPRGASSLGFGSGPDPAAPSDYTLETVARLVLGEGKLVASGGEEKIARLERLYREDPRLFGEYCGRDASLVLRILAKTGLWRLTLERALLTGVSLDKAWTSVASFERIYGMELRRRNIAPPPVPPDPQVSGAAGGTVLESRPGLFNNVAVFDFRSLYPTIMRTFNVDPLAHARADQEGEVSPPLRTCGSPLPPLRVTDWPRQRPCPATPPPDVARGACGSSMRHGVAPRMPQSAHTGAIASAIAERARGAERPPGPPGYGGGFKITAPNGAVFSREPGILPALVAEYFAARRQALEKGDTVAAQVYKILMNSFYGVLGTSACRYGRTELAGAITSFARKWLLLSRDWFEEQGLRVLYGDTDSLFVETGLPGDASYAAFLERCGTLARDCNRFLTETIRRDYGLPSYIELRFEKAYRRFLIPPLRSFHEEGAARGRAKGYGGSILGEDGSLSVEVKGMEAVRSDSTPLARRLQVELLDLVFSGGGEEQFRERVQETLKLLRQGKLDGELVYRKRLSRAPETYTASTPPQVKAARALGWHHRRGTVEFLWTRAGPAPVSLPHGDLDYDHYTDSQVLPLARSIAAAAGWTGELFPERGKNRRDYEEGQLRLDFSGERPPPLAGIRQG